MIQRLSECYGHISNDGKTGLALMTILGLGVIGVGLASLGGQNAYKWWSISDTIKKIGENNSIIMMGAGGVCAGIGVIGLLRLKAVKKSPPFPAPALPSVSSSQPASAPLASSVSSSLSVSESLPVSTPLASSVSSSVPELPPPNSSNAVTLPNTEHLTVDPDFSQQNLEELLSKEIVEILTKMWIPNPFWTVVEKNGETYYLMMIPKGDVAGECENVIHRVKPTQNNNAAKYSFHRDLKLEAEFIDFKVWFLPPEDVIFIDNRPVMLEEISRALKNYPQDAGNLFVFVQNYEHKKYCCIRRCSGEVFVTTQMINKYLPWGAREIEPIQLLAQKPKPLIELFTYDSTSPFQLEDPE